MTCCSLVVVAAAAAAAWVIEPPFTGEEVLDLASIVALCGRRSDFLREHVAASRMRGPSTCFSRTSSRWASSRDGRARIRWSRFIKFRVVPRAAGADRPLQPRPAAHADPRRRRAGLRRHAALHRARLPDVGDELVVSARPARRRRRRPLRAGDAGALPGRDPAGRNGPPATDCGASRSPRRQSCSSRRWRRTRSRCSRCSALSRGCALVIVAGLDGQGDRRQALTLMLLLAAAAGTYVAVQSRLVPYVAEYERDEKQSRRAELARARRGPDRGDCRPAVAGGADLLTRTIPATTARRLRHAGAAGRRAAARRDRRDAGRRASCRLR